MAFSTMTIDESTSTPTEIAIPASDMMFVSTSAIPRALSTAIRPNDPSAARGRVSAITNEARTWSKISTTQIVAVATASAIVPVTVPIAPRINGVRS